MKSQQQTPPTSTEYVEPLGFKGTKGEWDYWEQQIRSKDGWHIANLNPYSPEKSNTEANAKLIYQSKELAKALQDIVNYWIGEEPFKDEPIHKKHEDMKDGYWTPSAKMVKAELIHNAKQVLKQAGLRE